MARKRRRRRKKRGTDPGTAAPPPPPEPESIPEPENGPALAEGYMMPGFNQNPQFQQPPQAMHYMPCQVAYQGFYGQAPYYPVTNYHGYYYNGFQPQGEWLGDQNAFGLINQSHNYPQAMQPAPYPYAYYAPSYGFAPQPYYNYYGYPCMNGGYVGVGDAMPQYYSYPQHDQQFQPSEVSAPNASTVSDVPNKEEISDAPNASAVRDILNNEENSDVPNKEDGAGAA